MAQFASDAFTDTDGTYLSTHNASWVRHGSYTSSTLGINTNRVIRILGGTAAALYYYDAASASADYSVTADLYFADTNPGVGVAARINTGADTYYWLDWFGGNWRLLKMVAGSPTSLGTYAQSISAGQTHTAKLQVVGDQISAYINGTLRIGAVTDTAISAAGRAGIRFAGGSADDSATVGIHVDNFSGDDVGGGDVSVAASGSALTTGAGTQSPVFSLPL